MSTNEPSTPAESPLGRSLAPPGRYMAFRQGTEVYGVGILKVRELLGMMEITRVPGTRECVRGVINLRGKVVPVIDLRLKFGMAGTVVGEHTVLMLVQHAARGSEVTTAILVDEVLEVVDLGADRIEPTPELGTQAFSSGLVLGIGKWDDRIVFLLDIDRVLSADEQGAS
jgi:purine-binding chemotaxis protein CheW